MRSWYLPMIALFGQWALVRLHGAELIPLEVLGAGLILSYLVLFVFIAKNFRLLGIRILAIGVIMNFAVMAANGGFMPLSPDALNEIAPPEYSSTLEVGQAVPASKDILLEKATQPFGGCRMWPLSPGSWDLWGLPSAPEMS